MPTASGIHFKALPLVPWSNVVCVGFNLIQQDLDYLECSILPVPMLPIALLKFPFFFDANMVVGNRPCSRPHGGFFEPPNELLNRITIRLTPRPSVQSLTKRTSPWLPNRSLCEEKSRIPKVKFLQVAKTDWKQRLQLFQWLDQNPSLLDLYLQYGIKLIQIILINLIYHEA